MDVEKLQKNTRCLEESVNQLTEEHKSYFLGVLETLTFAQNVYETPALEPEEYSYEKQL